MHLYLNICPVLLRNHYTLQQELGSPTTISSTIICQCLSINTHIKIDEESIYTAKFSNKNLNFVGQFCELSGNCRRNARKI